MQFATDFSYLNGPPQCRAVIRTEPEDFQVFEELPFEPDGVGEHYLVYIRKIGENTDWVARKLARFCHTTPKEVGYAGKKDRHAITEQWFSVKVPIKRTVDWTLFNSKTIQVLKAERHGKKLKLGVLSGNRFRLRLRNVTADSTLEQRASLIASGVPNYFGPQRFGQDWGNLEKGLQLIRGELKERQRNKRSMYISALRSWLFNHIVSHRIDAGLWQQVMPGDALMLTGSRSCFVAEDDLDSLQNRLLAADLSITGPMWGRGEPMTQGQARSWEFAQLTTSEELLVGLEGLGLNQERRALRLLPEQFSLQQETAGQWIVEFRLPAGAFATSVLRELCLVTEAPREQES